MFDSARALYYGTPPFGKMAGVTLAYSAITGSFADALDLGQTIIYDHMAVLNETDAPIEIKFKPDGTTDASTIPIHNLIQGIAFDGLLAKGKVQIRYSSGAPTQGIVAIYFW